MEKFRAFVNMVGNAIMLNLLFLVSCLPVVTIGPAWCGMYSAIRYEVRGDKWFAGFKAGFRTRFLRSMITGILCTALCLYFANNAYAGVAAILDGAGGWISTIITFVFLLVTMMLYAALLPLNVYFDTDLNTWIDYAWLLMRKAPLQLIIAALLMWALAALTIYHMLTVAFLITVFVAVYFTLAGLIMTVLLKNPLIGILKIEKAKHPEMEQE